MTHEELLAKIKDTWADDEFECSKALYALRAVVELHKPWKTLPQLYNPLVWCEVCEEDYPCSTIRTIEKKLQ